MKGFNEVRLVGEIIELQYSHSLGNRGKYCDEKLTKMWEGKMIVVRASGTKDVLPILMNKEMATRQELVGQTVRVYGEIRTYAYTNGSIKLYVYVNSLQVVSEEEEHTNEVKIKGTILKEPVYRRTPSGRGITDLMLIAPCITGRRSHVPCIIWKMAAIYVANRKPGDRVIVTGRLQSREYEKKYENGEIEKKVTYEVSTNNVT